MSRVRFPLSARLSSTFDTSEGGEKMGGFLNPQSEASLRALAQKKHDGKTLSKNEQFELSEALAGSGRLKNGLVRIINGDESADD